MQRSLSILKAKSKRPRDGFSTLKKFVTVTVKEIRDGADEKLSSSTRMRQRQGHKLTMRRNAGMDPNDRSGLSEPSSLPTDRFSDLERAELAQRLDRLADVRASVVARGRKMVADPHYPDRKTIRRVSRILASHLTP